MWRTPAGTIEDFTGSAADCPPASLLYPFRTVGLGVIPGGLLLFLLLPGRSASLRVTPAELAALGAGLCLFALPLAMLGGSAQGLTRGLLLTLPCWMPCSCARGWCSC